MLSVFYRSPIKLTSFHSSIFILNSSLQTFMRLEKHLSEAKSVDARIIYQSYFAPPVDHTGDGFIDGDE